MLILGAVISASTAFVTSTIHEQRESKKRSIEKRQELNDQLAKDLSKRSYLTVQGYKTKRDGDSAEYKKIAEDYRICKGEWNLKRLSYISLLRNYYGQEIQQRYLTTIYNPLVELGQEVEYNRADSTFIKRYFSFERNAEQFISDLYKQIQY